METGRGKSFQCRTKKKNKPSFDFKIKITAHYRILFMGYCNLFIRNWLITCIHFRIVCKRLSAKVFPVGYDINLPVRLLENRDDIKTRCFCCGRVHHKGKLSAPVRPGTVSVLHRCSMSPRDFYIPKTLVPFWILFPWDANHAAYLSTKMPAWTAWTMLRNLGFSSGFFFIIPIFRVKVEANQSRTSDGTESVWMSLSSSSGSRSLLQTHAQVNTGKGE